MKKILFLICVLISTTGFTQNYKYSKVSLLFDSEDVELTSVHITNINRLFESLENPKPIAINIKSLALEGDDMAKARELSKARAQSLYDHLILRGLDASIIQFNYEDQHNASAPISTTNTGKTRQVDLNISYEALPDHIFNASEKPKFMQTFSGGLNCNIDSTLTLQDGTVVRINQCSLKKNKTCFGVETFQTIQEVQRGDLHSLSNSGKIINSVKLINIKLCNDPCDEYLIKVKLPLSKAVTDNNMDLWHFNNGQWVFMENIKVYTSMKGKFVNFRHKCAGIYQLGNEINDPMNKVRFKSKDGLKISKICVFSDYPNSTLEFHPTDDAGLVEAILPTYETSPFVKISVIDKNGQLLETDYVLLSQIPGKEAEPLTGKNFIANELYYINSSLFEKK